jgi:hypothetical protein
MTRAGTRVVARVGVAFALAVKIDEHKHSEKKKI